MGKEEEGKWKKRWIRSLVGGWTVQKGQLADVFACVCPGTRTSSTMCRMFLSCRYVYPSDLTNRIALEPPSQVNAIPLGGCAQLASH